MRCALALLSPVVILLCACSQHAPYEYGSAMECSFAQQRLHPDAPQNRAACDTTPAGLLSEIYQERYVKNMVEEKDTQESGQSATSAGTR